MLSEPSKNSSAAQHRDNPKSSTSQITTHTLLHSRFQVRFQSWLREKPENQIVPVGFGGSFAKLLGLTEGAKHSQRCFETRPEGVESKRAAESRLVFTPPYSNWESFQSDSLFEVLLLISLHQIFKNIMKLSDAIEWFDVQPQCLRRRRARFSHFLT